MIYVHSCPRCKGAVEYRGDELSCINCGWEFVSSRKKLFTDDCRTRSTAVHFRLDSEMTQKQDAIRRAAQAQRLRKQGLGATLIAERLKVTKRTVNYYLNGGRPR